MFGGGLPSDPKKKAFDSEKQNPPGVRVCVCWSQFGLNDERIKNFEWL